MLLLTLTRLDAGRRRGDARRTGGRTGNGDGLDRRRGGSLRLIGLLRLLGRHLRGRLLLRGTLLSATLLSRTLIVALLRRTTVETGGDDGDAHLVAQGVVDDGTKDDVGLGVRRLLHEASGLVDLEQTEVGTALDRQQDAVGAVDARLEQRARDSEFGGLHRAVLATGRTDAHERRAGTLHDGLDVGEVEVDQTWGRDEVGDALDTGQEHLVGRAEGVKHRDGAVADRQQPVVRDDDERVDLFAQRGDAELGLVRATTALEGERAGHDTDRQSTEAAGDLRDDGRTTRARATTLTGGDEHHVGALEDLFDLLSVILRRLTTDLGVGAGTETARQLTAHVELDVGVTHEQGLGVGVDRDELHTLEADLDHPVDGVDATAADTDDLDDGQVVLGSCHEKRPFESGCEYAEPMLRDRMPGREHLDVNSNVTPPGTWPADPRTTAPPRRPGTPEATEDPRHSAESRGVLAAEKINLRLHLHAY